MSVPIKQFLLACPLALATLVAPLALGSQPTLAVIALAVLSLLMLLIDWNRQMLLVYLGIFISGPAAEAIAIYFGAWSYARPVLAGIPLWLPFVWGNAALFTIRLKAFIDALAKG